MRLIFSLEVSLIVAFRSRYSLEHFLIWGRWAALGGVVLVVAIFGLLKNPSEISLSPKKRKVAWEGDFDKMISGPLALRVNTKSPLVQSLESKLVLLAQSARPDLKKKDRCFCIGVKGGEMQKVVREGEAIFVDLTLHESGGVEEISFVDEGKVLMIPHVLNNQSLLLRLEGVDEKSEIVLQAGTDPSFTEAQDHGVMALESANWWGPDLFFQEFGGESYRALGDKEQVEVTSGNDRYVLYLKEGDFLAFNEGRWHSVLSIDEVDKDAPLAQVKAIDKDQMEVEAWNAEGFVLFYAKLPRKGNEQSMQARLDQVICEPKLRNQSEVSCRIGKKHYLIKAGDWLIQKKGSWQVLRKSSEIEAFIQHDLRGELFVISEIKENGIVSGTFFNEARTQKYPGQIRAPSSKSARRKRGI